MRSPSVDIPGCKYDALDALAALDAPAPPPAQQPHTRRWNLPGFGERAWTSDAGWGCMLRTGQSMLATALIRLYLGRGTSSSLPPFSPSRRAPLPIAHR